jgi:cytoskeleton protein RodZ
MSDEPIVEQGAPAAPAAQTAGSMLREARQARGMHIAALAAAIKVTPRKLEALENDRHEELVDATFTRALAQAVCRALKIDAEPVLARLPASPEKGLNVGGGLNAPLRRSAVRRDNGGDRPGLSRPVVWGSAALVLAAVAVYFLPSGWLSSLHRTGSAEPAASAVVPVPSVAPASQAEASPPAAVAAVAASSLAPAASSAAVSVAPAPAPAAAPASAAAPVAAASAPAGSDLVVRTTSGPSWVEVEDARGKVLIARTVEAGESVFIAGAAPLRVKIGNVAVAQVSFRGQPVALTPSARDRNVARLELK